MVWNSVVIKVNLHTRLYLFSTFLSNQAIQSAQNTICIFTYPHIFTQHWVCSNNCKLWFSMFTEIKLNGYTFYMLQDDICYLAAVSTLLHLHKGVRPFTPQPFVPPLCTSQLIFSHNGYKIFAPIVVVFAPMHKQYSCTFPLNVLVQRDLAQNEAVGFLMLPWDSGKKDIFKSVDQYMKSSTLCWSTPQSQCKICMGQAV